MLPYFPLLILPAGCDWEAQFGFTWPFCFSFQAKETNHKQKEFEETAKRVRCAIEQLAALE